MRVERVRGTHDVDSEEDVRRAVSRRVRERRRAKRIWDDRSGIDDGVECVRRRFRHGGALSSAWVDFCVCACSNTWTIRRNFLGKCSIARVCRRAVLAVDFRDKWGDCVEKVFELVLHHARRPPFVGMP